MSISKKIEDAKKRLANAYGNQKITAQEYKEAIQKLEDKATEVEGKAIDDKYSISTGLKENKVKKRVVGPVNKTKKDEKIEEVVEYKGVDLEHYINPVLVLFRVGENRSLEKLAKKFSHRSSFTLLTELFYLCNSNGEVQGTSRDELVRDYGYQSGEAAYRAINELEELEIIEVDRSVRPNKYRIINYAENMDKGGFVISRDTMVEEAKGLLKRDYRAFFYNCFRRQHSPLNKRAKNSKLSTLKKYINAGSYEEVKRIYKRLEGKVLKSAKVVTDRVNKGDNLVKFAFDRVKMRIIATKDQVVEQVRANHLFSALKKVYDKIDIQLTLNNFKQGYQLIEKYGEGMFQAVKRNLHKFDQSKTGRVGYFEFLLNQAKIGAIL